MRVLPTIIHTGHNYFPTLRPLSIHHNKPSPSLRRALFLPQFCCFKGEVAAGQVSYLAKTSASFLFALNSSVIFSRKVTIFNQVPFCVTM